jgi:hypothetical protein
MRAFVTRSGAKVVLLSGAGDLLNAESICWHGIRDALAVQTNRMQQNKAKAGKFCGIVLFGK